MREILMYFKNKIINWKWKTITLAIVMLFAGIFTPVFSQTATDRLQESNITATNGLNSISTNVDPNSDFDNLFNMVIIKKNPENVLPEFDLRNSKGQAVPTSTNPKYNIPANDQSDGQDFTQNMSEAGHGFSRFVLNDWETGDGNEIDVVFKKQATYDGRDIDIHVTYSNFRKNKKTNGWDDQRFFISNAFYYGQWVIGGLKGGYVPGNPGFGDISDHDDIHAWDEKLSFYYSDSPQEEVKWDTETTGKQFLTINSLNGEFRQEGDISNQETNEFASVSPDSESKTSEQYVNNDSLLKWGTLNTNGAAGVFSDVFWGTSNDFTDEVGGDSFTKASVTFEFAPSETFRPTLTIGQNRRHWYWSTISSGTVFQQYYPITKEVLDAGGSNVPNPNYPEDNSDAIHDVNKKNVLENQTLKWKINFYIPEMGTEILQPYTKLSFHDVLPNKVHYKALHIYDESGNEIPTGWYNNTSSGQNISWEMKPEHLNGSSLHYTGVHYATVIETTMGTDLVDGEEYHNTAQMTFGGSERESNEVYVKYGFKPLNPPVKYVSDSDEKLVDSDTLTDIHEKYLYTLEGEFLELPTYDENKALKDWQLTDSTPAGITFDEVSSIKAYAWDGSTKGEDLTNSFEYSMVNGVLTIKAKPELLKDPKMYEEIHKVRFEMGARVTDEGKVERDENGKVHIVNNTKQSGHYYNDTTFDDPSNDVVTTVDKDTENALKVSKEVDKNLTENGTVDPVDTAKSRLQPITYTINMANTSATSSMDKVRILDVLPFNQDDRQTSFNAKGTAHVLSAQLVDANGEAVKGARLYYKDPSQAETNTKLDPNSLPQSATELAAKGWLAYDGSDASVLEKTSAILVDVDNIPANTTYALKITVEHKDNVGADLINNATVNSIVNQEQTTNNVETKIYGRELSGYVWYDDNYDGLKDDDEAPVKDIAVKLYRTSLENPNYKDQLVTENVKGEKFIDDKGNSLIKTDDKGFYNFSNLSEGHYIAEFEINGKLQTKEYQVTKFMADSSNSDAKNSKVKAEEDRITAQNPIKGSDWNDVGARLKDLDTVIKPKDGLQELPYNNLGLNRSAHLDIFKKNILGDGLAGAKFAIYRGDLKEIPADGEQSADFIGTYTTDKTGNLNVDQNLFAGYDADHNPISQTYTVFEIKAPNGYELLKTPVTFTVKEGNQMINLQIKDDAESILPFTGGKAGIGLLIALSLVVLGMLGLGGGLFYRHRKNSKEAA